MVRNQKKEQNILLTRTVYIIYSPVYSITDTTKHEDSKSEAQIKHRGFHQVQCTNLDQTMLNETNTVAQDDTTDEGWQQAVPEARLWILNPTETQKYKITSHSCRLHKNLNKNHSFCHKTHNVSYLMEPPYLP